MFSLPCIVLNCRTFDQYLDDNVLENMKGKYGTTNILFLNNMISINTQRDGTFALVETASIIRSQRDHIQN